MPVAQRQTGAELRERAYYDQLAWERHAAATRERPLVAAGELIDHFDVQAEALCLIDKHQQKEIIKPPQEYRDNARTALFEAVTASGHLSTIELTGKTEDVNQQVLNRLLNGFSGELPPHEAKRRIKEICEELTIQRVQALIMEGQLPTDTEVVTISDYPDELDDTAAIAIGYRPYNRKGMVRSTGFQFHPDGSSTRIIEQISRSNARADETVQFLQRQNVAILETDQPDVNVLGTQLLTNRYDYADGVVDLQRRLDMFKGEGIMYGESPAETTVNYEHLREVSAEREERLQHFVKELAQLEEQLDKKVLNGNITRQEAGAAYYNSARDIVRAICLFDPQYTKDALGEKSVATYERAARLMASGDSGGAADMVSANSGNEQAVTFCGNGEATKASQHMSAAQSEALKRRLNDAKENWTWTKGTCRTSMCPTRPEKTMVGPCRACRGCQNLYDDGKNPEAEYRNAFRQKVSDMIEQGIQEAKIKRQQKSAAEIERKQKIWKLDTIRQP